MGEVSGSPVSADSGRRRRVLIQNLHGSQMVSLSLTSANAVSGQGIVVAPGEILGLPFAGAIEAIASGSATPVRVQEI